MSQVLKNVCNELLKQNYYSKVHNVKKKLLSGIQNRDRWGNIINIKTLVCCSLLDPSFKNIPFTESRLQSLNNGITELTSSIIASNSLDNKEQPTYTTTSFENVKKFSIWSSIDSKVAEI